MSTAWKRFWIGLSLLAAASALAANECAAQGGGAVAVGSRLRIPEQANASTHGTGTVVALTADSVAVQFDGSPARAATLPIADLRLAQIATGHDRARWGLRGSAIGALIGAVAMVVSLHSGKSSDIPEFDTALESAVTPTAALVGLVGGGAIGFAVGALSAPERWGAAYVAPR